MVEIISLGDEVFFIPRALFANNDLMYHLPFPHISNQSSNTDLGFELLKSFDLARLLDIEKQGNGVLDDGWSTDTFLGLKTFSAMLRKSTGYSFANIRNGRDIVLERGKRKRSFIEGIHTYTIPLTQAESDIEEFGRKVRDTLNQTI